jgi:hypothetical protein
LRPSVSRLRFLSSLRSTATVIELGLVMTRVCLSRAGARRRVREGLTSRAHFSRRESFARVCGICAGARPVRPVVRPVLFCPKATVGPVAVARPRAQAAPPPSRSRWRLCPPRSTT